MVATLVQLRRGEDFRGDIRSLAAAAAIAYFRPSIGMIGTQG